MWAHLVVTFLGLWLMAAPAVLGYGGIAADHDRIVGPILATFACVALWEVMRSLRWVSLAIGLWLLAAPWILGFAAAATINSMLAGAAAAALFLVRGRLNHRFDGGWRAAFRSEA